MPALPEGKQMPPAPAAAPRCALCAAARYPALGCALALLLRPPRPLAEPFAPADYAAPARACESAPVDARGTRPRRPARGNARARKSEAAPRNSITKLTFAYFVHEHKLYLIHTIMPYG